MAVNAKAGTVVRLDTVEPITWSGEESARFLLRAEDTDGRFSYYEVVVPPGEGALLHLHEEMDETFHIIAGNFEITVGADTYHASAGTVVYGPRRVFHAFRNIGSEPGTMLCIVTPGGIERFFEELSDLLHENPPAEWSRMSELALRYRIVAVEPTATPAASPRLSVPSE